MDILALLESYEFEMKDIRRYLHQHPELSYQEKETSRFITAYYDKLGVSYKKILEGMVLSQPYVESYLVKPLQSEQILTPFQFKMLKTYRTNPKEMELCTLVVMMDIPPSSLSSEKYYMNARITFMANTNSFTNRLKKFHQVEPFR